MSSPQERPAISIKLLSKTFESNNLPYLFSGTETHDAALHVVNELLPLTQDEDQIIRIVSGALPVDYKGNTLAEISELVRSGIAKGLHGSRASPKYEPGSEGPLPLGYDADGRYALLDRDRSIISLVTSSQLLSQQHLLGFASSEFWKKQYLGSKGINWTAAGEALIAACRACGPFDVRRVRGRGVWREGKGIVVNLGDPLPLNTHYTYLCFAPLKIAASGDLDAHQILGLLRLFPWRHPEDALLLLGWLAIAPICGVLTWRPHCFAYGPPNSGKTTLHRLASALLQPLGIPADGQSTEAGIRQTLGPDSLPIIIDEFETDHRQSRLSSIIRLARSASSAESHVLRGTPEGKALQFSLRTTIFFSAINVTGLSPADETRIIVLELTNHDNNPDVARKIEAGLLEFNDKGPQWCAMMAARAHLMDEAIARINAEMPGLESRHRQNMATLLAGAFIAQEGRLPTPAEATDLIAQNAAMIERMGRSHERDDSAEALDFLFSHMMADLDVPQPLGQIIAAELKALRDGVMSNGVREGQRVLGNLDMKLILDGENSGLLLRHGAPAINRIFEGSRWANGSWQRALRQIPGAFSPPNPVHFPNSRSKSRCVGLPLDCIPIGINRHSEY